MREAHPLSLHKGMMVGPWRVLAQLGSGTFGTVLQVEQAGQLYALKLALHSPGSEDLNRTDGRATRELACLLQAVHPNVVRVWSHGRWPDPRTGYHYVVMDHVEGTTLAGWVRRERPSARKVARLFGLLARTLGELHARNVFHRDLKPSNILVRTADEAPVLVDFGSADHAESLPLTEGVLPPGTPHYRSPEALRFHREHYDSPGAQYPFRATDDLYALGVTLHEVLAGEPAFSLTVPREVLAEHIETRMPPPPSQVNPQVPAALDAITERLMRKQPEDRIPSGAALHAALEEALRSAGPAWDEPLFPAEAPSAAKPPAQAWAAPDWSMRPHSSRRPSMPVRTAAPSAVRGRTEASRPPARPWAWKLLGAGAFVVLLAASSASLSPVEASGTSIPEPAPASVAQSASDAGTDEPPPAPPIPGAVAGASSSPTTREQTLTTPTPSGPTAASRPMKKTLTACTAAMAAAASLHCASTPTNPGQMARPRKDVPCEPAILAEMTGFLRRFRHAAWDGKYPLESLVQLSFHEDSSGGTVLENGLKPGPIVSIVRNPSALPLGTYLRGWVWVEGDVAEIQYTEAETPQGKIFPICARAGRVDRRSVLTWTGSTPDAPRFARTDYYVVVDRW